MELSIPRRRVGTEGKTEKHPVERRRAHGRFGAGGLRTIRYRGREVLRAIAYVVRDKDWGTYDPSISVSTVNRQIQLHRDLPRTLHQCEHGQELEYETPIIR